MGTTSFQLFLMACFCASVIMENASVSRRGSGATGQGSGCRTLHEPCDGGVGLGPSRFAGWAPVAPGDLAQGLEQRRSDEVVHLRRYAVVPVPRAERAELLHEPGLVLEVVHHLHEHFREHALLLLPLVPTEERAHLRIAGEQDVVEPASQERFAFDDQGEAVAEQLDVETQGYLPMNVARAFEDEADGDRIEAPSPPVPVFSMPDFFPELTL